MKKDLFFIVQNVDTIHTVDAPFLMMKLSDWPE